MSKSRARDWADWASDDPKAAAVQLQLFRSFMDHRIRMLQHRKWAVRKAHRIHRLQSLRTEIDDLHQYLLDFADILQ